MKILLLNTYDVTGGASRACHRLFQGLIGSGTDAEMMVREQTMHSSGVVTLAPRLDGRVRALADGLPLRRYPLRQPHNFSPAWMPSRAVKEVIQRRPHVVHLHWVVEGFVQIEALSSLNCPIVWTLHDSWPFTGGCHLPGSCRRYEQACGCCPVLGTSLENDWSRRIWHRKQTAWKKLKLTVVAPSRWLAHQSSRSTLFADRRTVVIPNGIDTILFSPGDRQQARDRLGLPENRRFLLFGANHAISDANKGFDLLQAALLHLTKELRQTAELIVFGDSSGKPLPDCGLPVRNLGAITDNEQIVCLYRAADVFVAPSRIENLPNMVLESMACGTPCVTFNVGGFPELITHRVNGYLAQPYEVEDLAVGLEWLLADETRLTAMSSHSRKWIEDNASMDFVVKRYLELYQEIMVIKGN
jgi:glycosyltransferase involved in cell wall biosynthesis